MLYPYKFTPVLQERVWGGNALEHYGKPVPPGKRVGESWEISDRDDVQSVIANGPDKGKTLRQQIEAHGAQLLGTNCCRTGVSPVPSSVVTGISPVAGSSRTGVSPVPSSVATVISPVAGSSRTGVPPVPPSVATGISPVAGFSRTGVSPVPSNSLNGPDPHSTRFPLLVKLLDARERLSLQVHPPPALAAKFKGEPKTEMWYVLEAEQDAHLIAGLRRGVSAADFMRALESPRRSDIPVATGPGSPRGSDIPVATGPQGKAIKPIEEMLHRFPVLPGDVFFVPSGRMHAIDAGVVLVEIQQNSDTTYRVYDWGRVGLDGKPRQLHVKESLVCIDFKDYEPKKQRPIVEQRGVNGLWRLVECEYFHVHRLDIQNAWPDRTDGSSFHILTCISGALGLVTPDGKEDRINVGEFLLLPAALGFYTLTPLAENTRALKSYVPAST